MPPGLRGYVPSAICVVYGTVRILFSSWYTVLYTVDAGFEPGAMIVADDKNEPPSHQPSLYMLLMKKLFQSVTVLACRDTSPLSQLLQKNW